MLPGSELKAFIPGGASTSFMPPKFLDVAMDIDSLKQVGHRFGTGAIIVFDQKTCIRGALPRLRYDRLMHLGWKLLIPVALINIIVTGGIMLALGYKV
jgi:NADH-quinone oxidoreductase subunit F